MSDFTIEEVLNDKERMKRSIENAITNFTGKHPDVTPEFEIKVNQFSVVAGTTTNSVEVKIDLHL